MNVLHILSHIEITYTLLKFFVLYFESGCFVSILFLCEKKPLLALKTRKDIKLKVGVCINDD